MAPPSPPASDRPPLVGREREFAALRSAFDAALVGRGSLVLLGGEAGIGKTALAEWTLAEATQRGALALVGRCYDLSETPPHGPWAEAFARAPRSDALPVPPDLAMGAGAASQAGLFARVRGYLAALAATRPVVLLLEDLHWADPASLDLLRLVARDITDLPLLLLSTYRADELTPRHPLHATLPLLVREARATRLDLRPLDGEAIDALVAARYALGGEAADRLTGYLATRADGNPLFLGELLRTLEEAGTLRREGERWALGSPEAAPVPALLRQVIEGRAARLGDDAHHLLVVAAVLGQEVPLALWAAVAATDEEGLLATVERAVAARLLEALPAGDAVCFTHALLREALYEGMLPARRRLVHRRAGAALAAAPAPDPDAVADHFRRAGDPRACEWLVQAGHRAHRAYALVTAADRYEAALALAERRGVPAGERGWLLFRLAYTVWFGHGARRAYAALDAADGLAAEAGDRGLLACARWWRGYLDCGQSRVAAGVAGLEAGVAALDALSPAEGAALRAQVAAGYLPAPFEPRGMLVEWLAFAGHFPRAAALGDQILAGAGDAPLGQDLALAHKGRGLALAFLGRPDEARAAFGAALRLNRAGEHLGEVATTAGYELLYGVLPYATDRPGLCRALADDEAAAWRRAAAAVGVPDFPHVAALPLRLLAGDWDGAARLAEQMVALLHGRRGAAWHALGWLSLARGDLAAARAHLRSALPDGRASVPGDTRCHETLPLLRLAAELALAAGDPDEARAWLACHDRWLAWSGAVLERAEGQLAWATCHRAAGDPDPARRHAEQALAHATAPRQPLALLAAHRLLGELATESGQFSDAAAHLDTALALADACVAPYERALTLLALAELRVATGDRGAARAALDEARAVCTPLGARPALARADALAATLVPAAPRDAVPAALPFGLTAREAEVLRLLAAALPNEAIAQRLFLSPRTVSTHLTSIYAKLGVDGRPAAIRVALDHGLHEPATT